MPKKKGGKKKKGKKKKQMCGNETPGQVVKRLLRTYERNCISSNALACPNLRSVMRDCAEEDKLLSKFILEAVSVADRDDPSVSIEPFIAALRQERFTHIKSLHVWDIPLIHEHLASMALLLEKSIYPIQTLELMDCLVAPVSLKRLAVSFNMCHSLSTVVLDYNEFGDEGCMGLCRGLGGNVTVTSISLNYCDLSPASGKILGHLVSSTAVSDLYLDGNDLQSIGAVEIIKMCVDRAEEEIYEKEEAARLKAESEFSETDKKYTSASASEADDKSKPGSAGKKKKKKKKKGKKKGPPPPPPVGPWIRKLHLADNGIDALGPGGQLVPLSCMRLMRRLISNSKCLEELDLEDNLIGDLGGKELMEALQDRKDVGLGGMKMRTTHRMNTDTFNNIVKLGAGLKKKKKKKGKKKKK